MTINGVGARSAALIQSLTSMRTQLDTLQTQLGTGKKSTTYAGLGGDAALSVSLRSKLSAISSYGTTINTINTRIDLTSNVLSRISDLGQSVKSAATAQFTLGAGGQTDGQRTAAAQLDVALDLLNTQAGDRYLFSGRATDQPSVESADHILNGDGARAGFKQVMAERAQADLGADGLGRLVIPPASGTQVSMSEDVAGSPFGLKLSGVTSGLTGATVTGPTGSPAGVTVDLTANPNAGDQISFAFNLPDGTSAKLTLTATTNSPAGAGQFTIGATAGDTAANLQAALASGVQGVASTSLTAASAMAASDNFFNSQPPMRVAGPPFTSATALTAGTAANTVSWYTGEVASDSARGSAVAMVDDNVSVSYGVRANEQGIRQTIASMAVFASMTYSTIDTNAQARFDALNQRVATVLDGPAGQQTLTDIQSDLAYAQTTIKTASTSQAQRNATLAGMLDGIEGAPTEEVAAKLLTLQTQLQASLQTTAMLQQISILNYL